MISQDLWIGQGLVYYVYSTSVLLLTEGVFFSRLDLSAPTRNMGHRKLLKEAVLWKSKSGRKLRAFLCTDILVLTDEGAKTLYRMVSLILDSYDIPLNGRAMKLPAYPSRRGTSSRRTRYVPFRSSFPPFINILRDQHLLTTPSHLIADDLTIQVGLAYPRGGDKIVLRASSSREAHAWLSEIDTQSKKCRDAERKATIKAQQRNSRQY